METSVNEKSLCLVVNGGQLGVMELMTNLVDFGIDPLLIKSTDLVNHLSDPAAYVLFIADNPALDLEVLTNHAQAFGSAKWLVIVPQEVSPLVHKACLPLLEKLPHSGNFRYVYVSTWRSPVPDSPLMINNWEKIVLSGKYLDYPTSYAPILLTEIWSSINKYWFARSSAAIKVFVHTKTVDKSTVRAKINHGPNLVVNPDGEVFCVNLVSEVDLIQVEIPTQFESYLESLCPKPVLPEPVVSARNFFQEVVVEGEGSEQTPAPIAHNPPPIVQPPTLPQRRFSKIIVSALIMVAVTLSTSAALIVVSMILAGQTNENTAPTSIAFYQKLVSQLGKFSLLSSRCDGLQTHLSKLEATNQIGEGISQMLIASDQNPYDALKRGLLGLENQYIATTLKDSKGDKSALLAISFLKLLPNLIPYNQKITVAVLLQNNLELRPGGGFLGSVVLMQFDHGKLLTTDIKDVYGLDANLKGVVSPPEEVMRYLGESRWYLRDANWSPDFTQTAATINWFLEKEWGSRAEVVVGINLNTVQEVLQASGPLTLPDGQIIGADNLFFTALNSQKVPQVTENKNQPEFFGTLWKPLFDRLSSRDRTLFVNTARGLAKSLQKGDITIVSGQAAPMATLNDLGWSRAFRPQPCQLSACANDGLVISLANVGLNRVNAYVEESHRHTLSLTNNLVSHRHELVLTNKAPNSQWPLGEYKTYLRFFLPPTASLNNIKLDGLPLLDDQYTLKAELNRPMVGLLLNILPGNNQKILVEYELIESAPLSFTLFRQPGTIKSSLQLVVNSPPGFSVKSNLGKSTSANPTTLLGDFDRNIYALIERE